MLNAFLKSRYARDNNEFLYRYSISVSKLVKLDFFSTVRFFFQSLSPNFRTTVRPISFIVSPSESYIYREDNRCFTINQRFSRRLILLLPFSRLLFSIKRTYYRNIIFSFFVDFINDGYFLSFLLEF